jgi:hypothetical protein
MNINTKFSLGDPVVTITSDYVSRKVKCYTCNHTGRVVINDEEFTCPKCNGNCLRDQICGHKSIIGEISTIGKIQVEITDPKFCYHEKEAYKVIYMLKITGIGSGTLWNEKDLFHTREEAQKECDLRNASLVLKDDVL